MGVQHGDGSRFTDIGPVGTVAVLMLGMQQNMGIAPCMAGCFYPGSTSYSRKIQLIW
ncbi:hypothetical protein GGD50_002213 [Rhizobium paranaense]|uniref:Uncharacterized protein n=1 Tax=Rhizobium paranaense TaxID=1650438 RepID=A0A7W8XQP0_9HYPH|nr:hypothetical protein [Rhizobium paranaense]